MRWDPRETINPLLGSVHDPIYQGSRREFAEAGIPEPKLGLVTKAHGGVLFIDEIGEWIRCCRRGCSKCSRTSASRSNRRTTTKARRTFRNTSSGSFAKARRPISFSSARRRAIPKTSIRPIRSRCAEVYFQPLTQSQVVSIVQGAIKRLGAKAARGVPQLIASYTIEGRKAVQIVADAYGRRSIACIPANAAVAKNPTITEDDVQAVVQTSRLVQHTLVKARNARDRQDVRARRAAAIIGRSSRSKRSRFRPRRPARARCASTIPPARWPRIGVQRDERRCARSPGSTLRISTCTSTSSAAETSTVRRPGSRSFSRSIRRYAKHRCRKTSRSPANFRSQGKVRGVGGVVEKLYAARQAGMRRDADPEGKRARNRRRTRRRSTSSRSTSVEHALRELGMHKRSTRRSTTQHPRTQDHRDGRSTSAHEHSSLQHHTLDRIPPHNLEAEMALLGSVLVDKEMMVDGRRDR